MELKSVVLRDGPQGTAANALVNIGAVSEWTRFCEKCIDDRVLW
jgi:hypothetical protein